MLRGLISTDWVSLAFAQVWPAVVTGPSKKNQNAAHIRLHFGGSSMSHVSGEPGRSSYNWCATRCNLRLRMAVTLLAMVSATRRSAG